MKRAYFVVGPESAGNRMMTQALLEAKDFGAGGIPIEHYEDGNIAYEWNPWWVKKTEEGFVQDILNSLLTAPDEIIFFLSVPRKAWPNKEWVPIAQIVQAMLDKSYKVYPIVMSRFWKYVARSQVTRGHVPTYDLAKRYVRRAYRYILDELDLVNVPMYLVEYEQFVTEPDYRRAVLKTLDVDGEPQMEFFNANLKYKEGEDDINIQTIST